MTKEELKKDIKRLQEEIGQCEDSNDFESVSYLQTILVSELKELDALCG